MFAVFPLEKKNSEAEGCNTALGAFSYWINPAGESLVTLSATFRQSENTQTIEPVNFFFYIFYINY